MISYEPNWLLGINHANVWHGEVVWCHKVLELKAELLMRCFSSKHNKSPLIPLQGETWCFLQLNEKNMYFHISNWPKWVDIGVMCTEKNPVWKVTCSAVKSGSSLMQELMMECMSICSLSSSSSDRSRDWLSNFCRLGEGEDEIWEVGRDNLDEPTDRWLSRFRSTEQSAHIGHYSCKVSWKVHSSGNNTCTVTPLVHMYRKVACVY